MHRNRYLRLPGAVLLSVLSAAVAAAEPPRAVGLRYDVYTAGLPALVLRLDVSLGGGRYRIVSDMETRGLAGFLFPWRYRGETEGVVVGGELRPGQYWAVSDLGGEVRRTWLHYRRDGTVAAAAEPSPEEEDRERVPAEMTRGSVDVLTAMLRVARRMEATGSCNAELPVFDGLRRYDLVFADGGIDRASAMTPATVHRCSASMRRRAGFRTALALWDDGDDARAATIAVASLGRELPVLPVRLHLATPVGMARAELVAVTVDGRPLPRP